MTASKIEAQVTITLPWWFPVYTRTLVFFCVLCGTEPDWNKFEQFARRHIRAVIKVK